MRHRSNIPKRSRNNYLQNLVASCLKVHEQKSMSLEELVSVWSILREPKEIGEILTQDAGAQDWLWNYPDAVKKNEDLLQTLMHMIERHEIIVSKDLQVTLLENTDILEDASMDAHYAMTAIAEIRRAALGMSDDRSANRWLQFFSDFREQHADFIASAESGEYDYAA